MTLKLAMSTLKIFPASQLFFQAPEAGARADSQKPLKNDEVMFQSEDQEES